MQWMNKLFGSGLLDPEMERKLSESQRRQLGNSSLMDAGLAMLANSGYSYSPQTTGQALAYGLQAGRQSYRDNAQGIQDQMQARAKQEQDMQLMAALPPDWQTYARAVGIETAWAKYQDQQNKIALEGVKAKSKDTRTSLQKDLEAAGFKPGSSEYQDAINRATFMSKAPVTNVTVGGEDPFGKELAKGDAAVFREWRAAAQSAGSALDQLDVLEQINSLQQGGKIGEAAAMVGQFFGTEAAANMQTFNAAQKNMVLEQAKSLKGAMSDGDIRLLEESLMRFGNDPRANQVIIRILKNAANKTIQNYQQADSFVNKNGNLRGYTPLLRAASVGNVDAASVDLSSMSTEDLMRMAEEERQKRGR